MEYDRELPEVWSPNEELCHKPRNQGEVVEVYGSWLWS